MIFSNLLEQRSYPLLKLLWQQDAFDSIPNSSVFTSYAAEGRGSARTCAAELTEIYASRELGKISGDGLSRYILVLDPNVALLKWSCFKLVNLDLHTTGIKHRSYF